MTARDAGRSSDTSHFASEWLSLREPVDHRSRAHELAVMLGDDVRQRARRVTAGSAGGSPSGPHAAADDFAPTLVDLGAGTGSNMRYLSGRLLHPLRWRLLDHDAQLLSTIRGGLAERIECNVVDLSSLSASVLAGADVVTASALLDLVSMEWIASLCVACASVHADVLMALTIDGRVIFSDGDPMDASVTAWVAQDQRRDKGLGPALGGMAPGALAQALGSQGYDVFVRASDWRLDRGDARLARALIDGWRLAAQRQSPSDGAAIAAWARRRTAAVANGQLCLTVGHKDVLGLLPARASIRS